MGVLVLAGSAYGAGPVSADTGTPAGFHDALEGIVGAVDCAAEGWAVDPDDPYRRVSIRILADGAPVATGTADRFREDLLIAEVSPDGFSAFRVELWGAISSDVAHAITAQARDEETSTWVDLNATPKQLTCTGSPTGSHDTFEGIAGPVDCAAEGWAVDPDDPFRDLSIRILSDGVPVATGTADRFREDLLIAEVSPDGFSGFRIELWGLITTDVAHAITTQALNEETSTWVDLDGTPKELTCLGQHFTGIWKATDFDGSTMVMAIGKGATPLVGFVDSYATVCANLDLPTRMVGAGRGSYAGIHLFVEPLKTWCGRFPFGPLNMALYHDPGSDTLWEDEDGDGIGITWFRVK